MPENGTSIYQTARLASGLTQKQAAERLHASVRTVTAWETGDREPSSSTVCQMCELYATPWLALEHMRRASAPLGILPESIRVQELPTAVLVLINRATALADDYRRLMTIAEDGVIDATERQDFTDITDHIQDVVAACLQVIYAKDTGGIKKERPAAPTARRSVRGQATNYAKAIVARSASKNKPEFAGRRAYL